VTRTRKELNYFKIEGADGGSQDWFRDPMMNLGGCAAATACDSSLFLAFHYGMTGLYPFDPDHLTKEDYIRFASIMKPYLKPRWGGIDMTETYIEGFGKYLRNLGEKRLRMEGFDGNRPVSHAERAIRKQIDKGLVVPCLILRHKNPKYEDYVWHWFLLTGYDDSDGDFLVRTATYGAFRWESLAGLWNTGCPRKGGLVLYRLS